MMKKASILKLLAAVIGIAVILAALPSPALADTWNDLFYEANDGKVVITGYAGDGGEVTIPETIMGMDVTSIGDEAFWGCDNITGITVPDSVTKFGDNAFSGCYNLENFTISNYVVSIGNYAFSECSGLSTITIPSKLASIGDGAFEGCYGLESINVNSSNANYSSQNGVLYNKAKTELIYCPVGIEGDFVIPSSVLSIADHAFVDCDQITSISIPQNVSQIGDSSFAVRSVRTLSSLHSITVSAANPKFSSEDGVLYNRNKTKLLCFPSGLQGDFTMPNSVTGIGEFAFKWSAISFVTLSENLTEINDLAFYGCDGLAEITIPDGVTSIGNLSFAFCGSLETVTLPEGLTDLKEGAFEDCVSLETIVLPGSVKNIEGLVFYACGNLSSALFKGDAPETFGIEVFSECADDFVIIYQDDTTGWTNPWNGYPTKVFEAGETYTVTYDANSATEGTAPVDGNAYQPGSEVTVLGNTGDLRKTDCAFNGWNTRSDGSGKTYQEDDTFLMGNKNVTLYAQWGPETNGFLYEDMGDFIEITGYLGQAAGYGTDAVIPQTIEGKSVTSIREYALNGHTELTSIIIPGSVTRIGDGAFSSCSGLKSVTLSEGLASIGYNAFTGCTSLQSIALPASVTAIGVSAFTGCNSLTEITAADANASYSSQDGVLYNKGKSTLICYPAGKEGTFTIPAGVTGIADSAFLGCEGLTGVTISAEVNAIGEFALSNCHNLLTIDVNAANPSFSSQSGVLYNKGKTVLLCCPAGIKGAFAIPGGVTSIAKGAFEGCGLTGVTMPSGLTSIGEAAFAGCNGLTSLTLPNGVATIDRYAFVACGGLTSVTIPGSATSLGEGAFSYSNKLAKAIFQGAKPATIGQYAFDGSASGFKIYYPVSQTASWSGYTKYAKQAYCIVTIYPQNGSATSKAMTNVTNGHIAAPASPTRGGYIFSGWYKESACTHAWNFTSETIKGDISVYANWVPSDPCGLSGITLSAGALSPAFKSSTLKYTVTLKETDAGVTITPKKFYSAAAMTINGAKVASKYFPLANGKSTVVTVKLTYGSKSKTYTLTVTRPKSTNNTLSSLKASAGALSPAFKAATTAYKLTLPEGVSKTTITAVKASALATVSPASKTLTLNNGQTVVATFKVTAQSGAVKTYTVTVTRAKSTNNSLSSLKASAGALSPAFRAATTAYKLTLPEGVSKTTITAVKASALATVSPASRMLTLNNGQTAVVTFKVTAQSGAVRTYTVTVTRAKSTNASLASLKSGLRASPLTPAFKATTTKYTVTLSASTASVNISWAAASNLAKVTVNGVACTSKTVTVDRGKSVTLNIVVTAQSGAVKTYTVVVKRQ